MKPSPNEALKQAQAENEELKRLVCGLYQAGSFRSRGALRWTAQASRILVDNPDLQPPLPDNSR